MIPDTRKPCGCPGDTYCLHGGPEAVHSEAPGTLGEEVRAARLAAGWSLRGLSRQLSLAPSYLSDIERGNRFPPPETIKRLAGVLGNVEVGRWLWLWIANQMGEPDALVAIDWRKERW